MWPQEQGRRPPGRGSIGGAQPVGVATVARGDIKIVRNALGAVTPIANVIVKTQLNGYLTEVAFTGRADGSKRATSSPRSTRVPIRC